MDYVRIVYKRRWVAIPGFLLVFLSGAVSSIRTVPTFEARTQVLIEKDSRRATSIGTVLEDRSGYFDDDFYPTQYRILQSRALALRTVMALDARQETEDLPAARGVDLSPGALIGWGTGQIRAAFGSGPADSAAPPPEIAESADQASKVDRFLAGLTVAPVRASRLVDLKFRSPDPQYAQVAADELARQYIQQSLDFRAFSSREAGDWLQEQLGAQRQRVADSEAALQAYKERNNAAAVDEKQNIVVQRLNAVSQQVTQARFDLVTREAVYNQLVTLQRRGEPLDGLPAVSSSNYVQTLKARIASLRDEQARLVARDYGPKNPEMVSVSQSLDAAQAELTSEITRIASGLEAEYQTARTRVTDLERQLDSQKNEATGLDRKAAEYAVLEREALSNRQLYDHLLLRAKETGVSTEFKGSNIQVVDRAEYPRWPVAPNRQRDLMLAGLGGLALALLLAFGVEYFDSRIKSPDEIRAHLGLPFLGLVPTVPTTRGTTSPLLNAGAPASFAEAIRAIRTAVVFSSASDGARTVMVTSTAPSEGKTVVSSNLAMALAQAEQRTLLIDGDMRRPRVHDVFAFEQEPGLSNVLVGGTALQQAIRPTNQAFLSVLPAGHIPPNPAELLGSPKYRRLIEQLGKDFDWIVVDAPPVMAVTDASVISHDVGGVVFVVGSEMTPRRNAQTAIDQLAAAKARLIGVVLNRVHVQRHSYYYAPYYRKDYAKYYQRSGA
jgi:capsular exopolysaccharide synthesis family protein